MPGELDGMAVLRRLNTQSGVPPITVLTAFASAENTIEAMRLGAHDHLTKPVSRADLADVLTRMLSRGGGRACRPTRADPGKAPEEIVGASDGMRRVQKAIGLSADSDATVLITGETGTGKEVVARALHAHSHRKAQPFIPVNCAAIPADLLESELFGHVRGSFTGAVADRLGAFREADSGTLFLDEIGDMPAAMQAKILRVLQDRVVIPVGGRPQNVDIRLVAATHRDLPHAVASGNFRQDLFSRLNVLSIMLPPLRDRLADIVPLAEHFLATSPDPKVASKRLGADAASRLLAHAWPGNVRELRNVVERAAVLARGEVIQISDLVLDAGPDGAVDWLSGDLPAAVARLEAAMIRRALTTSNGNRAEAARVLGIQRQLLYSKIERYGLAELSGNTTRGVGNPDA
jgi:two-component system NtrC family response regulator